MSSSTSYEAKIADILERLNIEYSMLGEEFSMYCPFHEQDKYNSANFFINKNTGLFCCMNPSCVGGGSFKKLLGLLNIPFNEYELQLLDVMNVGKRINDFFSDSYHAQFMDGVYDHHLQDCFLPIEKEHKQFYKYLKSRKLSLKIARKWDIRVCFQGFYRDRLIFPIKFRGKIRSFGARYILKSKTLQKVLYPKGSKQAKMIYGYKKGMPEVIITESIIDALWLKQCGYTQAVSVFKSSMSQEQFEYMLENGTKRFLMLFDNDDAGNAGMEKARNTFLEPYGTEYGIIRLPNGKDPNECSEKTIDKVMGKVKIHKKKIVKLPTDLGIDLRY